MNIKEKSSLLHRNVLGALGMLLPVISFVGGLFVRNKPESWWYSISVTYYITPALPIILGAAAIFLMCYRSYETIDTIVNIASGIFAMGVVLFPCDNPYGYEYVGFFQIPVKISAVVHFSCAIALFIMLAFNIGFLFTKGNDKIRNRIYKICAGIMICTMLVFSVVAIIKSKVTFIPGWIVMVVETILLFAFGFAWLVKGKAFSKKSD